MSDIYNAYTTVTNVNVPRCQLEVQQTVEQFRRYILPSLRNEGIDLGNAAILEIGAGWGKNLLALKAMGGRTLHGVDISSEQAALSQRLGLESIRVIKPGENLTSVFQNQQFDLILALDVLEHMSLAQIEQFSRDLRNLMRPNGLLVVQVPNDIAPMNPIRAGDLTHVRAFTGASLNQFFRLCRLDPVLVRGVGFPGHGLLFRVRRAITRVLLGPILLLLMGVLYGRGESLGIYEPNILGIARRKVTH